MVLANKAYILKECIYTIKKKGGLIYPGLMCKINE